MTKTKPATRKATTKRTKKPGSNAAELFAKGRAILEASRPQRHSQAVMNSIAETAEFLVKTMRDEYNRTR